jgi:hypothetical protein
MQQVTTECHPNLWLALMQAIAHAMDDMAPQVPVLTLYAAFCCASG